jgi:hypothetical protein
MKRNARLILLLLTLLLPAGRLAAQAKQPLQVSGVQNLTFQRLTPGVPKTVLRTDAVGAARFDLLGGPNRYVLVQLTLPTTMSGPGGATIPLRYGPGAAGYSETQAVAAQAAFDPAQSYQARLSNTGQGAVFVGATASPAATQRPGSYTGTITLTITFVQ